MAADRKMEHLANVRMFSSLSRRELSLVSKAADVIQVKAGTEMVTEGKVGREFFLILEGDAAVKRSGRKVATLGPGNYFGELALLSREPRSATIVAATDMRVAVLGQREFMAVLDQVPALSHKLLVTMAERLREADAKAVSH